jgi:hypothetical protein
MPASSHWLLRLGHWSFGTLLPLLVRRNPAPVQLQLTFYQEGGMVDELTLIGAFITRRASTRCL